MKYIFNLHKTCIVKVKATGKPVYSMLKPEKKTVLYSSKELFEQYNLCHKKPSSVHC